MRDEGIGAGSLLVAFVAGALAGAAVALLFAPATGEETRRSLSARAQEGREKAEALARRGRDAIERQGEQLATAIERGREAYDQARRDQEPV